MPVTAIVGANWGDEGKGKMTDCLAADSDLVVRFQGGNNAGHTIINDYGKFALHLLPSGVFYSHITNVLGPGVALNIPALLDELDDLDYARSSQTTPVCIGPSTGCSSVPSTAGRVRGRKTRSSEVRLHKSGYCTLLC